MDSGHRPIEWDTERSAQLAKRAVIFSFIVIGVLLLLGGLKPYTDYLWFVHDARHPEVFSTAYATQGTLFTIAFAITVFAVYFSLKTALRQSLIFFDGPITLGARIISNAMSWVQTRGANLIKVVAILIGVLAGLGLSGEWNTWLLSRNGGSFGKNDPLLGLDLGFYVFQLPWLRAIANFLFGTTLLITVITLGLYILLQVLAALAKIELGRPKIRLHISILLCALALTYAFQLWLKTYEFGLMESAQFTGAGYAAMSQLTGMKLVAVASALAGIATLFSYRTRTPFQIPIASAIVVGALYIVGVVIIPVFVQKVVVEPDKLAKEGPFAKNAIEMTRFAYRLDRIEVKDMEVTDAPTAAEVEASTSTLDNMRLWDPEILRQAYEQNQTFRRYYSFNDVDLDRYTINGKPTMVMIAPRDIRIDGLDSNAISWVNTRLQYTHGFGVVVTPTNAAGPSGEPVLLSKDIPIKSVPDLKIDQPRVYFSDFRTEDGLDLDQYALVNTKVDEFDYLVEDKSVTTRWTGNRGVPVSGFFTRLAFSVVFGDGNLLVSGNISSDSKLLWHRSVLTRAAKIYPFLKFDNDPYLVIHSGRLTWILDGYSTAATVPYSETVGIGDLGINYIRNSVKVTIDAYSGESNAYALDAEEPVLRAYRKIYPNLIRDFSTFPAELRQHLRYPEDQLRLQALILRQYHVTDPQSFLNNGDAWDIPNQRSLNGKQQMRPYYVLMRLPDEKKDGFLQILPFSPREKGNLAGWLAAHCDYEDLGRIVLYKFTRGSLIPGPELMESNFNQNEAISNINRQLQNEQSDIMVGNLLVIPIGKSVMYAEPLFLKGKNLQAIPELRKVVLALKGKIVVGDTYAQALDKLFGGEAQVAPTKPEAAPAPNTDAKVRGVREALDLLDRADAALRKGDFATYGQLQKQARERLKTLSEDSRGNPGQ